MLARCLALAVAATACMPRYKYENARLPEPTSSPEERCYQDRRLELSAGDGSWQKQYARGDYLITEYWHSSGIAFRAGATLRPADQVVATLPDPELAAAYAGALQRTRSAHRSYPKWRDASLGIAFAGLGMAIGGLALALQNPESDTALPLALGGAGVALLSTIPLIGASRTYEDAIEHDIDRHLFAKSEWASRMTSAVGRYNEQVAASCGHARADVPMTPRARLMVAPSGGSLPAR